MWRCYCCFGSASAVLLLIISALVFSPCSSLITMQNEDPEEESRSYYASALHPKHSPKYMPTRRHSSEGSSSSSLFSRHGRSRTDSNTNRTMRRHHPLTNTRNDLPDSTEVTRPHLTRTVNQTDGDTRASENGSEDDDMEIRKEEERDVLVHQVIGIIFYLIVCISFSVIRLSRKTPWQEFHSNMT